MIATYAAVALLSSLSFLTVWVGVKLALGLRNSSRAVATGIGFSVGIMVLIAAMEMLPEAIAAMGASLTLGTAVSGAAALWAAHFVIPHIHLVSENCDTDRTLIRSAYLVVFGLILHDVPEGFAMANACVASPALGVLVALAIGLHNIPEAFVMAMPLVMAGSRRSLYGAALLSALAEPLGAVVGLVAVGLAPALNAHFLAFAAGAMLFVSVHELVPMAKRYRHLGSFFWGMALSALVYVPLARMTTGLASA